MNEVRDILAKALPDVQPASNISRDGVIAAGRRARTRRNWVATAAAGVGTLVVGAGVASGILWDQRHSGTSIDVATTPSASWSSSPTTSATPSPTVTPSGEPPPPSTAVSSDPVDGVPSSMRNVKPALTAAFRAALAEVAPEATVETVKGAFANSDVAAFEVVRSQGGFKTWAEVNDRQGKSTFFAYMSLVSFEEVKDQFPSFCSTANPGMTCTTRVGGEGELVRIEEGRPNGSKITQYNVSVTKPDGSSMDVIFENYSWSDQNGPVNAQPQRPLPTLTVDQLVALLLSPKITVA